MSENQKMEFKINCSPDLSMSEITKRLFNRNFHSDVQFSVQGKIIYAHSLELIKRSLVFEQQLDGAIGEKKLIPVTDYKYENFLEFIRYIYTDECTINEDNFTDILKLAAKYKFIKLENHVLRLGDSVPWLLKQFGYCVREKYEMASTLLAQRSAANFGSYLAHKQFLSLHADVVDELLKFDHVTKGVTEVQIFTTVAEWITAYCKMHQITLSEGRQRWDKLIRKVRFPTMSNEELRKCYTKYPELINDNDQISIARQTVFGDGGKSENELWISRARKEYIVGYEYRTFLRDAEHKTILSVSNDTFLHGLQVGIEEKRKPIEIEISEFDDKSKANKKLKFVQNAPNHWNTLILNIGESISMKPGFIYTINIKYFETDGKVKVIYRGNNTNLTVNDPGEAVTIIQASGNITGMFFSPATD